MKKLLLFLVAVLWFCLMLPNASEASNIKLNIRDFNCLEDGKVIISFSLVNTRDFDYPNVSLCFMVTIEGKPVACRELRVVVEKGADGSRIYETAINAPCGQGSYGLKTTVFHSVKRYKIEEWFAGCPGTWKSTGNDKLE